MNIAVQLIRPEKKETRNHSITTGELVACRLTDQQPQGLRRHPHRQETTMSAADLHGLPAAYPPQNGSPPDAATLNEMIARNKFLEGGCCLNTISSLYNLFNFLPVLFSSVQWGITI